MSVRLWKRASRPVYSPALQRGFRCWRIEPRSYSATLAGEAANTGKNPVACCLRCNNRKGDPLANEAGMTLRHRPKLFSLRTSRNLVRQIGSQQENPRKYPFY